MDYLTTGKNCKSKQKKQSSPDYHLLTVLHVSPRTHQLSTNHSPRPLSVHAISNSLNVNEIFSSPLESLLKEVHLTAQDHTQLPLDTGPHLYSWDDHGQSKPVTPSVYHTGMVAFANHIREEYEKDFDLTHSSNDPLR